MDTVIFACKTLENELRCAMAECECDYDVKWLESGLHNVTKKLTSALQDLIDSSQSYSRALLALGYCGNSLVGLRSGNLTLTVPRVDDCISLLLGSYKNRLALTKNDYSYFITEGWLRGERNIWREYEYAIKKFGEDTGREIYDAMFGHYKTLAMLDTNCYDFSAAETDGKRIAAALGLEYKVIPATIVYIKRLLDGPWDDISFLTVPPYSTVGIADLTLDG